MDRDSFGTVNREHFSASSRLPSRVLGHLSLSMFQGTSTTELPLYENCSYQLHFASMLINGKDYFIQSCFLCAVRIYEVTLYYLSHFPFKAFVVLHFHHLSDDIQKNNGNNFPNTLDNVSQLRENNDF